MLGWLKWLWTSGPSDEGFGQSHLDDLRFLNRFWRCRRMAVTWRKPTDEQRVAIEGHAIVERFGDYTLCVADAENRRWIVRERDWHGWPDPPMYVFFALEGEAIWAAVDFDRWPRRWTPRPPV